MRNTLCLLLSLSLNCINGQSMESIESTVQKVPGDTLILSCRGSGFSFDCCSMHWIRQQDGKPLVWMGRVHPNGQGRDYSKSFEGRIEITRDNSKSMTYLKLSGLTAEDTVMYYCAKQAHQHKTLVGVNKNYFEKTDAFDILLLEVSRWQQRMIRKLTC